MPPESNRDAEVNAERELEDLEDWLTTLQSRRDKVFKELTRLDALLAAYNNNPSKAESTPVTQLKPVTKPKQTRVRGVLAAARKAIEQLPDPFDKNQLVAKLKENNEEFAQQRISGANIRSSLRLLTQEGVIKVESEATATTCAKYVKAR